MSFKSSVALSTSTALGITLLGLSATLFTVDVTGTIVLEKDHRVVGDSAASVVTRPIEAPAVITPARLAPAAANVQTAAVAPVSARPRHLLRPQAPPPLTLQRGAHRAPAAIVAKRKFVQTSPEHHAARQPAPAQAKGVQHVALQPIVVQRPVRAPTNLVTLRGVRRFVISELNKTHKHVCVISAMTYAAGDRHVIVDLVYRDDKGRWLEKAVVRRAGHAVKLIRLKRRPLPYKTVASTGHTPAR